MHKVRWINQCDVSNEQQVEATVNGSVEHFGTLQEILNNAGLMIFKKIEEQTGQDWERILNVDLMGAFFSCFHPRRITWRGGVADRLFLAP